MYRGQNRIGIIIQIVPVIRNNQKSPQSKFIPITHSAGSLNKGYYSSIPDKT